MVHISMEASEGCAVPKDLFLSLRVGDIQKFSKAGASKTYKFPPAAVGDRRYGKIEVYKRIGICSVMIDPGTLQGAHEISVPLDDERLPNLRYRFNLAAGEVPLSTDGGATKQEKQSTDDKPLKDPHRRVKAAKDYLDKHQLEIRLAEAMQAVLRERPDDPGAFIANKLVNRVGLVTKVDVDAEAKNPLRKEASAAPEAPPEALPQAPAEEASAPVVPWDLKPSVGSWASKPGVLAPPKVVPQSWISAKASWMDPTPNAPAAAASLKPQEPAWNSKPSVGSWATFAPTPLLAPLGKKKKDVHVGECPAPPAPSTAPAEAQVAAEAAVRKRPAIVGTGRTALGRNTPFLIL